MHRSDSSGPFDRTDTDTVPVPRKRQLWTYSGLGIETHDSPEYRYVRGQLQRALREQNVEIVSQGDILQIHVLTIEGIYPCAGHYRDALTKVEITDTDHKPG